MRKIKINFYVCSLLILNVLFIGCKEVKNQEDRIHQKKPVFVGVENNGKYMGIPKGEKGEEVIKYIDSLNNGVIPHVLENLEMDFKYVEDYLNYGDFISTRKVIFDNVDNEEVLLRIVDDKEKNYNAKISTTKLDSIYEKYIIKVPYTNLSIRDLAENRLSVLRKNNN